MYKQKLMAFENVENLGGKAWEYAVVLGHFSKMNIKSIGKTKLLYPKDYFFTWMHRIDRMFLVFFISCASM
jgi:hypothetical protein